MKTVRLPALIAISCLAFPAMAHEIESAASSTAAPPFDITRAVATTDGALATLSLELAGAAGSILPDPVGSLPGAPVNAYVWVTGLDPAIAGFAPKSGILAVAVTAHPDFDDTPKFDENGDGDAANDGKTWHSHFVVLEKTDACKAGFKVRDIAPGEMMPPSAPGLPIALDSPGDIPVLNDSAVTLVVPLAGAEGATFDGLTAALRVNAEGKAPLLCVEAVHDIASGDLTLPGRITLKK